MVRDVTQFTGGEHVAGTSGLLFDVLDYVRIGMEEGAETAIATSRWPSGIKDGAGFVIPQMG